MRLMEEATSVTLKQTSHLVTMPVHGAGTPKSAYSCPCDVYEFPEEDSEELAPKLHCPFETGSGVAYIMASVVVPGPWAEVESSGAGGGAGDLLGCCSAVAWQ